MPPQQPSILGSLFGGLLSKAIGSLLRSDPVAPSRPAPGVTPNAQPGEMTVSAQTLAGDAASIGRDRVSQYFADAKSELAAAGLPTSAPHARVGLINEAFNADGSLMEHGEAVARSIAGPMGLAQGAQISYSTVAPPDSSPEMKAMQNRYDVAGRVAKGQGTLSELAKAYAQQIPAELHNYRDNLERAAGTLPPATDGSARMFLNMSNAENIAHAAEVHASAIAANGLNRGTPLYNELARRLGPPGPQGWSVGQVAGLLRDDMRAAVKSSQGEIDAARADLGATVQRLRKQGVVVFAGAGNDGERGGAHPEDGLGFNVVPGMIVVGATDIGDPNNPKLAGFSSGAKGYTTISAVGTDLPVGRGGELVSGTSFATPVAVSIAALMTEANPKLTPDDIQAILTDRRVARDLPGDRDGAGQVDPVAAVKLAKGWRPRS